MANEIPRGGGERNARLAAIAARQWGNVTRAQLRGAGFSEREADGMVARRQLHRRHHGVYAYGAPLPAPEARWAAALLAAGPVAALSHTATIAARGLIVPRAVTEVTVPTRRRGDTSLRVHQAPLPPSDVTTHRGLRITGLPRTLLDLAAIGWPIDRLTHEAAASGLTSLDDLRAYADAAEGRKGVTALRRALEQPHTRSAGERRLHTLLTRAGIAHEMNHPIGRLRVDAFLPDLGIAIELDHADTHGGAYAERRDAWRDRYLTARNIEPLRVETADLAALVAELRRREAS